MFGAASTTMGAPLGPAVPEATVNQWAVEKKQFQKGGAPAQRPTHHLAIPQTKTRQVTHSTSTIHPLKQKHKLW